MIRNPMVERGVCIDWWWRATLLASCFVLAGCVCPAIQSPAIVTAVGTPEATVQLAVSRGDPPHPPQGEPVARGIIGREHVTAFGDGTVQIFDEEAQFAFRTPDGFGTPYTPDDAAGPSGLFTEEFVARALANAYLALPDTLITHLEATDAVSTEQVRLAHDLVDFKGTTFLGTIVGGGPFVGTLTLTDAGRAKLRAALDRREASTRPSTRP